jgi:hypothetical protein
MSNSDLFKNVDRSLFTFNLNNIIEICYDKVVSTEGKNFALNQSKLSMNEKVLLDNCIDKYMKSFNIVKQTTIEHLDNLFNKRG